MKEIGRMDSVSNSIIPLVHGRQSLHIYQIPQALLLFAVLKAHMLLLVAELSGYWKAFA